MNNPTTPQQDHLLEQGLEFHQKGNLPQAEKIYHSLLQNDPDHVDALQLLGTLYQTTGQLKAAVALLRRSLALNPSQPHAHNNLGNALKGLKRHEDAIKSYESAIRCNPHYAEAFNNRGLALNQLGRHQEALESYKQAIFLKPDFAEAFNNQGSTLRDLQRYGEALQNFDRAITLKTGFVDAFNNQGTTFYQLHRYDEALESYQKALTVNPNSAETINNRGMLFHHLKRHTEALEDYQRAISLNPNFAVAHYNLGNLLGDVGRDEEAIQSFGRAIELTPHYIDAFINRGNASKRLARYEFALKDYDYAISLDSSVAEAHWNKSQILLLFGRYLEGWKLYEWRWQKEDTKKGLRNFSQPLWNSQGPIADTILLHSEQGLGDSIQMLRYVPLLAALGSKVIVEVPSSLVYLAASVPGVSQTILKGEQLPDFDMHCPLMSLPHACKTETGTIPMQMPYFAVPEQKKRFWSERLGMKNKLRIGLVWSGNKNHKNDHKRSIALQILLSLLGADAQFYSLQHECRDGDRELLKSEARIIDYAEDLKDFSDTGALIQSLDLVIAVDTAVAHLAGALGKAVWILLPLVPDHRWLLGRDDSPWYPSARLFRQTTLDEWAPVIEKVQSELLQLVNNISL